MLGKLQIFLIIYRISNTLFGGKIMTVVHFSVLRQTERHKTCLFNINTARNVMCRALYLNTLLASTHWRGSDISPSIPKSGLDSSHLPVLSIGVWIRSLTQSSGSTLPLLSPSFIICVVASWALLTHLYHSLESHSLSTVVSEAL